ncbi:DUF4232 domain-containing protein [Streptomyces sp. HUAS TT20]|uniref:DUF4232 domain-containing protein n=1 Tax=Streptomyces sp. HUAS TT20 TaxID=3447509 RepID=UPI0021DACAD3|nr:DUF4232 domain-containing protein [Streptomyces sp. HUAS 15-9]UXY32943.1 DUF4232 domain-containing protein [Streptomyces sp. HUAS 15-9]
MSRRAGAVCTVGLVMLLGAAACGQSGSGSESRIAACATPQLSWKMTLLPGKPHDTPTAMLSAAHKGSKPCAFDGYPELSVYVGKGPSADSKPKQSTPVHLVLKPGHSIAIPVFYDAVGSPSGSCEVMAEYNPRVEVRPPHPTAHDYGSRVQLTDEKGHHRRAQVCDLDMLLGAPQLH